MKKHIKKNIKSIFYSIGLVEVLDKLIYTSTFLKNRSKNKRYKLANPDVIIPPDYYLYETYKLDYESFITDGRELAEEIIEWTRTYILKDEISILDWGCGVSRTIRHMPIILNDNSKICGCDINKEMIEWNKNNLKNIEFSLIDYDPPTGYEDNSFDLAYGISIFTHIEKSKQILWFNEIYRILNKGGIFLFTTHGTNCFENLLQSELSELNNTGAVTKTYQQKGHRMMTTYNKIENIKEILKDKFEVLELYQGEQAIERTGAQDLWIIRKI